MTVITIGENSIEISGHAPEKVVCHGVSAISNMVANYVEDCKWGKVTRKDGYLKIYDVKKEYIGNPLFRAFTDGLKDTAIEYPGNLEIKYQ